MAEFPALPVWTDAYLADTRHLSTLEHGAYFLLILEAWRRPHCNLPDDDKLLARLAGLSGEEWAEVKGTILAFWKLDGRSKTWSQKRLSAERMYLATKSKVGKDAAAKRWNKGEKDDANALPKPCQTDAPTPTPTPTPTELKKEEEEEGAREKSFELFGQEIEVDSSEVVRSAWNIMAANAKLPSATRLTETRKTHLRKRLEEYPLAEIVLAISEIPSMPFLMGENDKGWRANFDYLLRPDSVAKINEGRYHHGNGKKRGSNPNPAIDLLRQARDYLAQNAGAESGGSGAADDIDF